jgi:membrane protein implicated in regulation of membrane protease activity
MTDVKVEAVLDKCATSWKSAGISPDVIQEMRAELESHLMEAGAAGKNAEAVVGPDVTAFANAWAATKLGTDVVVPRKPAGGGRIALGGSDGTTRRMVTIVGAIVALFVLALLLGRTDDTLDLTLWQWTFFSIAVVLAVGEIFSAAFFLLPFAIGAALAGVLAIFGVHPAMLMTVFVLSSSLGLWGLQRYALRDDGDPHRVGATRFVGMRAIVTETVRRSHGVGRVRMDTEDWRATTDLDIDIEPDTEVLVTEVRGTRLVVVPIPDRF